MYMYATALRIAQQLRRDKRTIALLLLFPSVLITLLRFVFDDNQAIFNVIGGPMLAVFPFLTMFLVSSVVTLRERTNGTLERLMAMPVHKIDIIAGYAFVFSAVALLQALIAVTVASTWLGLAINGEWYWLCIVATLNAILGVALGLFASSLAKTEFQAVQFLPVFAFPQILLCGLLTPRDHMHPWLEVLSQIMPLSYAVDAVNRVVQQPDINGDFLQNISIVAGVSIAALVVAAISIRRTTR